MQPVTQDPATEPQTPFSANQDGGPGGPSPKPLCEVVSFSAGVLRGADVSRVKRDTRCATARVGFFGMAWLRDGG